MRVSDRAAFFALTAAALGALAGGLALGDAFRLQPCYWCSFQRFVYLLLAAVGLCGLAWPRGRHAWGALYALIALGGGLAAGRQSWMQYAPQRVTECGFGEPTLNERLVDWLSGWWPEMFMVTGTCKAKDWVFLGLSLANWSGVCFLVLGAGALWLVLRRK